ncbi:MAG: hybrid sensor histidine kinase/response regulator [Desulfobulbaceae bacterium]|nr:hybrid sensor histidine kinase/response regulator [Desulfobulbaceae bacterium]
MSATDKDLSEMSMMELFRMEAESHCSTLVDELLVLENNPADPDALASLMRAAHSIKGAARIVNFDILVELTHAMEDVFSSAQDGSIGLGSSDIDTLLAGVDLLGDIAGVPDEQLADRIAEQNQKIDQLINTFRKLAAPTPDNTVSEQSPPSVENRQPQDADIRPVKGFSDDLSELSMLDLFRQELEGHGRTLTDNLLALEDDTAPPETLASLMRAAHSIKGAARIMDFELVVLLAHAMEDLFVAGQEGVIQITRQHVDDLLKGVDLFTDIIRQTDNELKEWFNRQGKAIDGLAERYREAASQKDTKAPLPPGSVISEDPEKSEQPAPAEPQPAPVVEAEVPEQSLRVSAEGLNRLMGLAGEVQVESHWLPSFILKLLRLKHDQDKVYRLLNHQVDSLHFRTTVTGQRHDGFKKVLHGMENCRKLVNDFLVEIEDHARRSTEISYHLHQEVIANRMRPFSDWLHGFPRMVRDLSRELGKEIKLEIIGADTLVDRDILDKIESPLNHMIRNAVDHGIEYPEERKLAGKPEKATIRVEARHRAGMLNIIVSDDGRGVDLEKLRRRVIDKKMIAEEVARALNETELLDFLFLPNFSTRDKVSTISGRGVGLDVVHRAIHEVRGIIRINTTPDEGSSFEMQLPLTLSVTRSLLVTISEEDYAFPLVAIDHVLKLRQDKVKEVEGRQYVTFNGERIGLVSAHQVLEKSAGAETNEDTLPVLVISDRHNRYGLIVDAFIGIRDLVVHPLDKRLQKVQDINAAAILEDGTPVLIVDVEDMVRSIDHLISGNRLQRIDMEDLLVGRRIKRVLVVDDSITVREVERKMISGQGYDVEVAVDGQDGWNSIRNEPFDLVITDVDMPRLDGIELVTLIRQDQRFKMLPIIIVSYKDREEDRNRGLEAGADYYLTKGSFQDETLVKAVEDLIGGPEQD